MQNSIWMEQVLLIRWTLLTKSELQELWPGESQPEKGFDFGFFGKGSHKGTGETVAYFMTAIAYGKGVIAAEQYHRRINAEKFSSSVREHFASMFKKSANPRRKLFLQNGDPSQNSVRDWYSKIYHSTKKSRSEPYRKYLSYCEVEVTSKCFGSTDNPRRFCCLLRKSQDYTGNDTY